MCAKNIDFFNKILRNNLCNRCGTCVGLSGGKIIFEDKTGRYLPKIIGKLEGNELETIIEACSGWAFDFPGYRDLLYDKSYYHTYIGPYKNIYIGYSNDSQVRLNSASGGILSSVLIWLLEKKMIDGAVVLQMSDEKPWLTEPVIATNKGDILNAAQSKYIISSTNEILPEIGKFQGKLAYVGLPGQVQSIRKLQVSNHPAVKNIEYIFGPFYGNTLHFSSIRSLLRSYGIKDYTKIKKLYFRYGEWPGNMRIELSDDRVIELKKFYANYLIPSHILKNSLLCTDFTNEFTDISGGDAWAPQYEERGKGFSLVIPRTEKGLNILSDMQKEGWISLDKIDLNKAISMHSHGYDLKKRGAFIRLRFRKLFGKMNPDYGYKLKGFPFLRYLMEILLDVLFRLLRTQLSRWLITKIPPIIIGSLFERIRTFWKRITHNIKRKDLS
jgi:coenzyme F420 hydrogenase subunit beta